MRSDVFRRIVPAALLAASFPVLLAALLGLTAPLWLPLLTAVLSAGSAAALSGGRRPWLPYLCWAGLCAAAPAYRALYESQTGGATHEA